MTEQHQSAAGNPRSDDHPSDRNPAVARIIRRAPTGAIPVTPGRAGSGDQRRTDAGSGFDPLPTGVASLERPGAAVPIATSAVAILSGWATSVVATDLVASWWRSDRLFCVAVGFLTLVFAMTTISGVILLLLRRSLGRYLIAIGAVVALLTFGSLFIAGARVPWIVHAVPVIQAASAVLALHPATKRWVEAG